jgi:hypothetical protein
MIIQELKNPQYHSNPDAIIRCVTSYSINGDNNLLDEWLERFRMISNSIH